MEFKKYHTPITEIHQDDLGIVYVKFKEHNDDFEFDKDEALKQLEIIDSLIKGEKSHVIIDTSLSFLTPTKEAKNLLAEYPLKKSEAIIIKHLHQRITVSFFLKISHEKYAHPKRLFSDPQKAFEWTKRLLADEKVINEPL